MSGPVGFDGQSATPLPTDVHSEEELESYLDAVSQHIGLDLAARQIGSTATQMTRLFARDPVWKARLDEALEQGERFYADRLRATARVIALRTEPDQVNARILEVELATHAPGYEHLRRDRVRHEGSVEHTVRFDPEQLDRLSERQLAALEEALLAMGADTIDVEPTAVRQLPAA